MKQVFYDPNLTRWKRLRRITDVAFLIATVVGIVFIFSVVKRERLPDLLMPVQQHNYRALKPRRIGDKLRKSLDRPSHRRSHLPPSEVTMNEDEGLRAAFYQNDEPSYSALKQHIHQIDMLFPDWLHVVSPSGELVGATPQFPVQLYDVADKTGVHGVDPQNRIARLIAATKEGMEVFPMLNDYNPLTQEWSGDAIGKMLESPAARQGLFPYAVDVEHFVTRAQLTC